MRKYKEQQAPERGFAFLKDPLFFADSVFLKTPQRIETMTMLMGLCLLVYSLGQRQIRSALQTAKTGIKNQLGKLTHKPTLPTPRRGSQESKVITPSALSLQVNNYLTSYSLSAFSELSCLVY